MTADQILQKHEDANEMHFYQVDREFIIQAMEEYATSSQTEISDEEIEQEAHIQYPVNLQPNGRTLSGGRYDIDINYSERNAYILSAKWMRDKIQNK